MRGYCRACSDTGLLYPCTQYSKPSSSNIRDKHACTYCAHSPVDHVGVSHMPPDEAPHSPVDHVGVSHMPPDENARVGRFRRAALPRGPANKNVFCEECNEPRNMKCGHPQHKGPKNPTGNMCSLICALRLVFVCLGPRTPGEAAAMYEELDCSPVSRCIAMYLGIVEASNQWWVRGQHHAHPKLLNRLWMWMVPANEPSACCYTFMEVLVKLLQVLGPRVSDSVMRRMSSPIANVSNTLACDFRWSGPESFVEACEHTIEKWPGALQWQLAVGRGGSEEEPEYELMLVNEEQDLSLFNSEELFPDKERLPPLTGPCIFKDHVEFFRDGKGKVSFKQPAASPPEDPQQPRTLSVYFRYACIYTQGHFIGFERIGDDRVVVLDDNRPRGVYSIGTANNYIAYLRGIPVLVLLVSGPAAGFQPIPRRTFAAMPPDRLRGPIVSACANYAALCSIINNGNPERLLDAQAMAAPDRSIFDVYAPMECDSYQCSLAIVELLLREDTPTRSSQFTHIERQIGAVIAGVLGEATRSPGT